jgi:hypothetical protein
VAKYDPEKVEFVKLSRATRVKVEGAKAVKLYDKGAVVKVSGNDKSQLLASGGTIVIGKDAKESDPAVPGTPQT